MSFSISRPQRHPERHQHERTVGGAVRHPQHVQRVLGPSDDPGLGYGVLLMLSPPGEPLPSHGMPDRGRRPDRRRRRRRYAAIVWHHRVSHGSRKRREGDQVVRGRRPATGELLPASMRALYNKALYNKALYRSQDPPDLG
eukprot:537358-Prorocentrum_minimum.AAC.1